MGDAGRIWVWVAVGALAGGLARYLVAVGWLLMANGTFPWPTLAVNVIGSALIGAWFALASGGIRWCSLPHVQALVMAGFCGGLTTFSIFSLETLELVREGAALLALLYVIGSLLLWLPAVWMGHACVRRLVNAVHEKGHVSQ